MPTTIRGQEEWSQQHALQTARTHACTHARTPKLLAYLAGPCKMHPFPSYVVKKRVGDHSVDAVIATNAIFYFFANKPAPVQNATSMGTQTKIENEVHVSMKSTQVDRTYSNENAVCSLFEVSRTAAYLHIAYFSRPNIQSRKD